MKTLRVFYTLHQRQRGTTSYKKIKIHSDFSHDDPMKAKDELIAKYGRYNGGNAPDEWIEIHSHTFVDPHREREVIPSEKVIEQSLLAPDQLFAAQSRKPESTYVPRGRK